MTIPRVYRADAIVLRQRRLGEADKIVTLHTAQHGKLDAVAKGVRRPTSRLGGHLEALNHVALLLARGRDLDVITQAQTVEPFRVLRDDLNRLSCALYAAEIVDRITPERAPALAVFNLLLNTLRRLSDGVGVWLVLRYFEMQLLDLSGYRPELMECVTCRQRLQPVVNSFSPVAGGALCRPCAIVTRGVARPLTVNALKVLRLLQRETFEAAARLQVPPPLDAEIEGHLRSYLYHVLERDVRSAAFVEILKQPTRV